MKPFAPQECAPEFPLEWRYSVVADARPEMEQLLRAVFGAHGLPEAEVAAGKSSGGGKYRSYRIAATFANEEQMRGIDCDLSALDGVKFVL